MNSPWKPEMNDNWTRVTAWLMRQEICCRNWIHSEFHHQDSLFDDDDFISEGKFVSVVRHLRPWNDAKDMMMQRRPGSQTWIEIKSRNESKMHSLQSRRLLLWKHRRGNDCLRRWSQWQEDMALLLFLQDWPEAASKWRNKKHDSEYYYSVKVGREDVSFTGPRDPPFNDVGCRRESQESNECLVIFVCLPSRRRVNGRSGIRLGKEEWKFMDGQTERSLDAQREQTWQKGKESKLLKEGRESQEWLKYNFTWTRSRWLVKQTKNELMKNFEICWSRRFFITYSRQKKKYFNAILLCRTECH